MKKRSVLTPILLGIVIVMSVAIVLFLYGQYKASKEPVYKYVSMSDEAAARAFVWLNEIEDNELTFEQVKECMGDFNLELVLVPTEEKGVYTRSLAEGAYDYVYSQSKVGFEKAYKIVVKNRLQAAGFEGECTDETVEELMQKTYGVSVEEYLEGCDVKLIPTREELEEEYSGEVTNE